MTNDNNHKLRAVILAAVMVFSVIAMSGAASAEILRGDSTVANAGTISNYDVDVDGDGAGNVTSGAVIFQGEDLSDGKTGGISSRDASGFINPAQLSRASEAGGQTLSLPVPRDQARGNYSLDSSSFNITVDSPRISTFDVNNNNTDINGGILTTDQTGATVDIEFNFERAEQIDLTIEDEGGVDVTNEFLQGNANATINATQEAANAGVVSEVNSAGDVTINITPAGVDEGEYTFTAEGNDDLAFGEASQSTTINVVSEQKASIEVGQDPAIQGDNNDFTLTNSPEGSFHAVVVEDSDFRDNSDINDVDGIFRNVGDTVQTGLLRASGPGDSAVNNTTDNFATGSGSLSNKDEATHAFAVVEIDGGNGVGSLETQFLDDTSAQVEVFPSNSTADTSYLSGDRITSGQNVTDLFNESTDDDIDFQVTEGQVSLTSPDGNYIVGSEVDVSGEANSGIDEVAIYARDQGNYELVTIDGENTIQVEGDNTFEETDVTLSSLSGSAGNNILSIPGSYRIGVIAAQDADTDNDGTVDNAVNTSTFSGGVSSADSVVVTDTRLNGNFTTYNGQVAVEDDSVNVQGTAVGKSGEGVAVIFVGPRGGVSTHQVSVESDGAFDEDDLSLSSGDDIAEGTVTAHIISSGRDQAFGDDQAFSVGEFLVDGNQTAGFNGVTSFGGTANQVNDRIVANSVDDTGSDDLIVTETFRLADGLTTIESITSPVSSNGTIELEGQTNKQPDDNTIVIELLDQEDNIIESTSTDQWGTDGVYSAEVDLSDVEPGNYTLEVDDGDNTDRASVEVVEQVQETPEPTPEPTPTEEPTPTATPEPTPTATPEPTPTATPTPTPTSTPTGTPGFGIVVALVALVAAALLAVRRNN